MPSSSPIGWDGNQYNGDKLRLGRFAGMIRLPNCAASILVPAPAVGEGANRLKPYAAGIPCYSALQFQGSAKFLFDTIAAFTVLFEVAERLMQSPERS
jgi:hypothetical protein